MFTPDVRRDVLDRLVERARCDERITSAALVGSLAAGSGDAWSDIDLSFGVADDVPLTAVVEDWTRLMNDVEGATSLFEVEARGTTYRVFLREDCLQIDLSFTPGGEVRKASPRFTQLFGEHHEAAMPTFQSGDACGWAVHLAHAARVRIERGQLQQAAWCITALRERLVQLHCAARGLQWQYVKGADQLPAEVLEQLEHAFPASTDPTELERALVACIDLLEAYDGPGRGVCSRATPQLRAFRGRLNPS